LTRRGALGALGALLGSGTAAGCGWLTGDLDLKLPDPDPNTPLTIDAHSHVFNLSDTPFRDFVKHAHPDQAAIVDLLGDLGTLAPTADKELAELGGSGPAALLPAFTLPSAPNLGERQYQHARSIIRRAQTDLEASRNPRKLLSAAAIRVELARLQPNYQEYKKH